VRSAALEVNAEVVPAVSEASGRDDGVQEEMAKTMVRMTWTFASCISEEVWSELAGAAVSFRALMRTRNTEGFTVYGLTRGF
jgi:leucyl-tRNA synthetase